MARPATTVVTGVPEEVTGQQRRIVSGRLSWRHTFSALKHRNFRLFFAGQMVSLIGTWMQNTAQGWLVYDLTGSKILLGVVAAVGSTPMMLFSVWGGSLADRFPKRQILLWTQTTMMVTALIFAALVATEHIRVWHIMFLAAIGGLAMAFDMPARQAFMVEMSSREDLMNAVSLNSSIVNGARVLGPSMAGLLMAAHAGIAMCFFLNGLSFIAVIAGLLLMKLPKFVPVEHSGSALSHMLEGFHYVWKEWRMRTMLILFAIVGIFGWSYSVMMPAFAREVLHVDEKGYGILLSANGVGALLGALTVATFGHRANRRFLVLGGLFIFAAMLLQLAFVKNFYVALICLGIAGWGMLLFFSTINTLLQTSASDAMRGRVMGIWALVFGAMTPLGGLEAGMFSHFLGLQGAIAFGAVVCALAAIVVWFMVRRISGQEAK